MPFEVFKKLVIQWANPLKISVKFNRTNGRYYGNCSNGSTIIGNSVSKRIAVRTFNGRMYYWAMNQKEKAL